MNWKAKYLAKHLVQKGLGAVPGLFRAQEWFKGASGRWDRIVSDECLYERAVAKAEQFEGARLAVPRRVLEQGTGWHGANLVILHLAGAQRIDSYDTRPWLQAPLLLRAFKSAGQMAEGLARWSAVDVSQARARARELEQVEGGTLKELLGHLGAHYSVTTGFNRSEIPSGACNLVFTNSVLQRLKVRDLQTFCTESTRLLAPSGRQHHVIDCKDFHSITDSRVPELHYLTFGKATWELMTSAYLNFQNRLCEGEFVRMFERAGCSVRLQGVLKKEENVAWFREQAQHLRFGQGESLEDAGVTRFELCASRPAESPAEDAGPAVGVL